jgi:hypothetical protein
MNLEFMAIETMDFMANNANANLMPLIAMILMTVPYFYQFNYTFRRLIELN